MQILYLVLKSAGKDYIELRFFVDNPNEYQSRSLPLAEIADIFTKSEEGYYTYLSEDYAITGKKLYNWLDGSDRFLANFLNHRHQQGLIIAISSDKKLANLPWELLHDGDCFLVEKRSPIIPVRWISNAQPIKIANSPQNRPLNVLFIAPSPLGVEPVLDYEAEEAQILEATKRTPMELRVEESGCLTELGYVVQEYEKDHFDVFHLTGYATHQDRGSGEQVMILALSLLIQSRLYRLGSLLLQNYQDGKPCFLTEDEYGNPVYSSIGEIAQALQYSLPPLIFLSGFWTGYSTDATIPSMAEEFLNLGITAVLGWGERVSETYATASVFYSGLAQGRTLRQALSSTYRALIQRNVRDWHKLRLYVANTLPQALVTPLKTRGRKILPKPFTTLEFRDYEGRLRVASREDFVGRRRQLQNCLRTLKADYDKVGVLIHGMGGLGKSSIASRLWDRLPEYEKVLWWRQIDAVNLIKKLKDKLINPSRLELIPRLENSQITLKSRLAFLFSQLAELGEKPFLLTLDDFEWNLGPREGRYLLKPEVAEILAALVEAIQETGTDHRIIITCRYVFDSELLEFFFLQGLEPFMGVELTKKLNRLEHFSFGQIPEDVWKRALNLADGNPRLLEFLNNEVLGREDAEAKLTELEQSPELWKDKIIWEELYELIDQPLQQILSHCLVYEIPVPMVALEAVCHSLPNYQQQLKRGREMGLLEVSPELQEENKVYRVSRILPHIIAHIRLPQEPEVYFRYRKAHEKLHQLWGDRANKIEEKWREIFRLLFADKENATRFRQGFSQMLEAQYNQVADRALEFELRKLKAELSEENLCGQLEDYLRQDNWRKADEETAWIFYIVMVLQEYDDWHELCRNFPSEIFNEIDRLWVFYSEGHFGFSVQKRIWESLGGNPEADYDTWENFGREVEWYINNYWRDYNTLSFSRDSVVGNLPALYTTRGVSCGFRDRVGELIVVEGGRLVGVVFLFSHVTIHPSQKETFLNYRLFIKTNTERLSVGQRVNLTVQLQPTKSNQDTFQLPENILEFYCFINTDNGLRVIDSEVLPISIEPKISHTLSVTFELQAYLIGTRTYSIEIFTQDPQSDKTSIYKYTDRLIVNSPAVTERFPTIFPTLTIPVAPQFTLQVETELPDGDKSSHHITYYLTSSLQSLKVRREFVGTVILKPADLKRIQSLLNQMIQKVTYLQPKDAREQLISLGQYFFDLFFPSETTAVFRESFWKIFDQTSTLLIIEDGVTSLPWELVVPYREDETTFQSFWGEQYHIARWIQGLGTPLYHKIPFGEVALTHYQTLNSEQQQAWEQLLKASNMSNIRQVVHPETPFYAVHWLREAAELQQQDIVAQEETDPKPSLEREIPQSRLDFRLKRPLVTLSVLNQENTNTENLMLTERVLPFLRAGASAVVGTWWQTSEVAEQLFWSQFYDLLETGVTLGEAVWRSRLRVRQALPDRPDWLAYTLFGNPRAKPYQPQDSMGYTALECLNPDEPFRTHKPYYFRASIRMRPPVWYKDSLIQPEELSENFTALFLCPDLETPSEAIPMQSVGRTIRHATVPITAPKAGNYVLRVQLFEEEEYLKTLSTTLKVFESTTEEAVNG